MTCRTCGIELEDQAVQGSPGRWLHPGGSCPLQTFLLAGVPVTQAEMQALLRVARAQLEIEARRGRNG